MFGAIPTRKVPISLRIIFGNDSAGSPFLLCDFATSTLGCSSTASANGIWRNPRRKSLNRKWWNMVTRLLSASLCHNHPNFFMRNCEAFACVTNEVVSAKQRGIKARFVVLQPFPGVTKYAIISNPNFFHMAVDKASCAFCETVRM